MHLVLPSPPLIPLPNLRSYLPSLSLSFSHLVRIFVERATAVAVVLLLPQGYAFVNLNSEDSMLNNRFPSCPAHRFKDLSLLYEFWRCQRILQFQRREITNLNLVRKIHLWSSRFLGEHLKFKGTVCSAWYFSFWGGDDCLCQMLSNFLDFEERWKLRIRESENEI